jgi:hypothetical protein
VQTVGDLQKSLFGLRFNGQVSDQIVMLSRLGVQFQDSYGRARDFNDVMLDTASALEKAQAQGQMTRGEAFEFAQQSGFTGGMAQIVLSGRKGAEAELAKQRARAQVNAADMSGADRWVRSSVSLGQGWEATKARGMDVYGDTRGAANEKIEDVGGRLLDGAIGAIDFLGNAADAAGEKLGDLATKIGVIAPANASTGSVPRAGTVATGRSAYASTIAAAAKRHGVPPEILEGLIRTESNFNPYAVNAKTGATGIAQFMPATAKEMGITAGKNPAADIDAAARYLKKLRDQAVTSGMAEGDVMPWVVATGAYNAGMGNVRSGRNIGPEALAYPGKVLGATDYAEAAYEWMEKRPGGTVTQEVHIDQINVNTQATDANGIASEIGRATQRQLMTAQAEGGIQ